jgi:hypothetical protein
MHKNTTLLVTLLLICLIIIFYINNYPHENFDYRTINQGALQFKHIYENPHYTCIKKEDKNISKNTKDLILDLHDLDEYEYQYKNYIDWIHNEQHYETYLTDIISKQKKQLENSNVLIECAKGCNVSTQMLIEKLTRMQHLQLIEHTLDWQEKNVEMFEKSILMFKKQHKKLEDNLGVLTINYIDSLEKNKYTHNENKDFELNQIKDYIESLNTSKKWLENLIKINEKRLKLLKESIETEKMTIKTEKDLLKPFEKCTKYCNTCPVFNKLSSLIAMEHHKNMIPQYIKGYENNIKKVDNQIDHEKNLLYKNPQIKDYLDCREKCQGGKIPLNKPDSCNCINKLTNQTLRNFIDCTTHCNEYNPTVCYNNCVNKILDEQIFINKPMIWFMNRQNIQ